MPVGEPSEIGSGRDDPGRGDVVWMGLVPVVGQYQSGLKTAEGEGDGRAGCEGIGELAVPEVDARSMAESKDAGSGLGFSGPDFRGSPAGGLAPGQVQDSRRVSEGCEVKEGAAGVEFHVVGMGSHRDHIERLWQVGHRGHTGFVAAIRKIGLIASNRIRSSCSMPRAMFTIQ